jgi:hypothetical protein
LVGGEARRYGRAGRLDIANTCIRIEMAYVRTRTDRQTEQVLQRYAIPPVGSATGRDRSRVREGTSREATGLSSKMA